jgi:hypothetical protein
VVKSESKTARTSLTVRLCCDDAEQKKRLRSFVEAACEAWAQERKEKREDAVTPAEWRIEEKSGEQGALLLAGIPAALRHVLREEKQTRICPSQIYPCVAVLPDNRWDEDLNGLLQNPRADVLLTVRGQEIFNGGAVRHEDVFRLSGILKRLERSYFRAKEEQSEEEQSKPIDWKCGLSGRDLSDSSFISFFSDPAMSKMARDLKNALLGLERTRPEKKPDGRTPGKAPCVLLLGETGTGKTLAAEWLSRQLFPRQWERWKSGQSPDGLPLASLNVGTLQKSMVDVELFGALPGAYTGAPAEPKEGFLERHCWEKVIFLDEIGEMEPESQVRLLKYLDGGEVRKVGATEIQYFPAIVVAATNRPLDRWARMEREDAPFRADLFYRFDHVVKIPSLKERKEDMRLLISLLLQDSRININRGAEGKHAVERISMDAIGYLENASYPGNFRDLRGRIRNAAARASAEGASTLCLRHLL